MRNIFNKEACIFLIQKLDDSGWQNISDGVDVYVFDLTEGVTDFSAPRIRVTRKLVTKGSIASGYDVVSGDKNVDAYRYIIEVSSYSDGDVLYEPLLDLGEQLDMYLSYATTDAIETNYNSFALVMPYADLNNIIAESGKKISLYSSHNGRGTVAKASSTRSAAKNTGAAGSSSSPEPGFATGGTSSSEDSLSAAVEYSDWTDTSYTDARKTVTYTANGETTTIDSRTDGNMVLPKRVKPGDSLHTKLEVESVIGEAEDYSYFSDLVIYDLYSTGNYSSLLTHERNRKGYDVDYSSIKVKDNRGFIYEEGKDYDIYYTNTGLIELEHHPIDPVNSLRYAADYKGLETAKWTLYKEGENTSNARGFKIVMKDGAGNVYNNRSDIDMNVPIPDGALVGTGATIIVEFDATVPSSVTSGYTYPNVEAYSAKMHTISTGEEKDFKEDTTAVEYRPRSDDKLTFKKEIKNLTTVPIPADSQNEFTYLFIRLTQAPRPNNIFNTEDVEAAAVIRVKPDIEYTITNCENMDLIYTGETDEGEITKNNFFQLSSRRYLIVELDPGIFTPAEAFWGSWQSVSRSFIRATLNLGDLNTSDEKVNEMLSDINGSEVPADRFSGTSSMAYNLAILSYNYYSTRNLVIKKVDTDGNLIEKEVSFRLKDEKGNVLKFEKEGDYYKYSSSGTIDTITLTSGTGTVRSVPAGKYTLEEVSAPQGYKTTGSIELEVPSVRYTSDENLEVTVTDPDDDEVTNGTLIINKIDADTKELIADGKALFRIYDSKDEDAEPLTFIKDGSKYKYDGTSAGTFLTELETTDGVIEATDLPFLTKAELLLTTYAICFGISALIFRAKEKPNMKVLLKTGLSWSVVAVTSYGCLFAALHRMNEIGRLGIMFPIACSTQILSFCIVTPIVFHERFTRRQIAVIALIIIGIFAVEL